MKRRQALGLKPEETKPGLLASSPHPGILSSLLFLSSVKSVQSVIQFIFSCS